LAKVNNKLAFHNLNSGKIKGSKYANRSICSLIFITLTVLFVASFKKIILIPQIKFTFITLKGMVGFKKKETAFEQRSINFGMENE